MFNISRVDCNVNWIGFNGKNGNLAGKSSIFSSLFEKISLFLLSQDPKIKTQAILFIIYKKKRIFMSYFHHLLNKFPHFYD